jgi:integrase
VERKLKYVPSITGVLAVLGVAKEHERIYIIALLHTMARMREIHNLKWQDVSEHHLVLKTRKARSSNVSLRRVPVTQNSKKYWISFPEKASTSSPTPERERAMTTASNPSRDYVGEPSKGIFGPQLEAP